MATPNPNPRISAKQAANYRVLLEAHASPDYKFGENQVLKEIEYIFGQGTSAAYHAKQHAREYIRAKDDNEDLPDTPFTQKGLNVQGELRLHLQQTHRSKSNKKPKKLIVLSDDDEDAPPAKHAKGAKKPEDCSSENDEVNSPESEGISSESEDESMEGTTWKDAVAEVAVTLMVEGDTSEHVDKSHKLIRTITNFRFVSRDNPTEMVSVGVGPAPVKDKKAQVHLIGLVASANLEFEMGQRAQAGLWWVNEDILKKRPFHMVFMKIPVHEIQVYAPTWWRDGKTLAVVVWGSRGVYVLQGADLQYHHRYALCTLDPLVHAMRPVNFLTLPARPSWIDAPFFENMKHDYRLGSQLHPENMAPPPLPKITAPEQKRLRLEGDIASRQCTTRVLNQEIKALLADKEKVAASKIKPAEKKRVLQEYSTEIQAIKEEVQVNKAFLGDLDRKLADLVKLGKKKQAVSKKVKDKGKANGNSTGPGAKSKDVELVNIAQADPQSSAIEHTTAPIPKSISTALSPPEVAPEPAPSPVPDSAPEAVSGPAPMDVDDAIEDTAPLVVIEDLPPLVEDPAPPVAQAASSQSQMQVPGPSSAAEISQLLGVHPGTSQGADIPIDPALLNEEQLGLFRALHESTPPMGGQVPGYGWGGFFMPNIPPP